MLLPVESTSLSRLTATVVTSQPLASRQEDINSRLAYFPVPVNNLLLNR